MKLFEFINSFRKEDDSGIFRRVPLDVPGRLYTSPMPYGAYDRGNRLMKIYQKNKIDHAFMLLLDEEIEKKASANLRKKYEENGIGYSQYKIKDFTAPAMELLQDLVAEAITLLKDKRIALHCHAGVGRTGTAVCAIVRALQGLEGGALYDYVSEYMSINLTEGQKRVINRFQLPDSPVAD